jgi:hypothetical protein
MLLEIAMSETPRRLNLVPRTPLNLMVLNSPDAVVGLGPWKLSSLRASGIRGRCFLLFEIAMGEKAGSLIAHQVSLLDGWLRLLLAMVGQPLGTSGFGVSKCTMT